MGSIDTNTSQLHWAYRNMDSELVDAIEDVEDTKGTTFDGKTDPWKVFMKRWERMILK
jgi:hypothetical protein